MSEQKVPKIINDFISDNVQVLAKLFPSAVKDGQVDFTALKEELGQFEEVDKEKYELTWAGKQEAKKKAQEDVFGRTLKYIHEDSKNPETTENLYIEGDNLEVLKLLRQNYYNSIKVIFIDPPYNTGKDFVYNDNYKISMNESDIAEGTKDVEGHLLQKNQKSSNRFHAKWLNMIFPRLKVAKDLLLNDGVVFISIDDNEMVNLKKICDEIFGFENFVASAVWRSSDNSNNDAKQLSNDHNYILIYSKQVDWQPNRLMDESKVKHFKNPDNDPNGPWFDGNPLNSPNYRKKLIYDIVSPSGNIIKPPKNGWRWSEETLKEKMKTGEIRFNKTETNIKRRTYLKDSKGTPPSTLWTDLKKTGHNRQAKYELLKLIPEDVFDTPKPVKLVKYIIDLIQDDKSGIYLDFFSGSGTTAQAIMQANADDNGKRKFILIQLAEDLDKSLENASNDNKTVIKNAISLCNNLSVPHSLAEIAKERIRRAGEKIKKEIEEHNIQLKIGEKPKQVPDIGFKVFRTAYTNIKWNLIDTKGQIANKELTNRPDLVDFIYGANDIDVVYEIMLRQKDIPLSEKLEVLSDIGDRTYLYGSAYLICLETEITEELIDQLAALKPLPIKFVFRDSAFKDDINLKDDTFRRLKNLIDRNSGAKKNTYTVEFI